MGEADPTLRGPLSASAPAPPAERRSSPPATEHAPPERRRPGRRPPLWAIAAVAVVIVGGGLLLLRGLLAGASPTATPEAAAQAFFDAWKRGDSRALSAALLPSQADVELTDPTAVAAALKLPQNRGLLGTVRVFSAEPIANGTLVESDVIVAGQHVDAQLQARRTPGQLDWHVFLFPAAMTVTLPDTGSPVEIDGIPVHGRPGAQINVQLIPGYHVVHVDGSPILAPSDTVTHLVWSGERIDVVPAAPSLLPNVAVQAHASIHAWLTQCAAATQLQPGNGCPQGLLGGGTIGNVHWTLTNDAADATVGAATPTTVTIDGTWGMSATWDDTDLGYTAHNHEEDGGRFTATLTWNGSGFDVQLQP